VCSSEKSLGSDSRASGVGGVGGRVGKPSCEGRRSVLHITSNHFSSSKGGRVKERRGL